MQYKTKQYITINYNPKQYSTKKTQYLAVQYKKKENTMQNKTKKWNNGIQYNTKHNKMFLAFFFYRNVSKLLMHALP